MKRYDHNQLTILRMTRASHHFLVLGECEIVLGHGDDEDDGRHALETVDPLLTLRPLTSHVKHSEGREAVIYINTYIFGYILNTP